MPTLRATPTHDVPLDTPPGALTGLLDKVDAAVGTVNLLAQYGLKVRHPSEEDKDAAAALTAAFAANPEATNRKATVKNVAQLTPPTLLLTQQILRDYAHNIVQNATQIRHLVTNKLIQETENPDPKVRIKALELLGKIGDVGLFSEKTEVTITHQTTDDLRAKLKAKLQALRDVTPADQEDAPLMIDGEAFDLDNVLGTEKPSTVQAVKTLTVEDAEQEDEGENDD